MGFLDRIRRLFGSRAEPASPERSSVQPIAPVEPTIEARVARAVQERRWDDALEELRRARGGRDEAFVLDALLFSLPIDLQRAAPSDARRDALLLAVADLLVARGDRARACELLRGAASPAARVLRADLLVEGVEGPPSPADHDLALSSYADALRHDLDAPGVRERWERLRVRLGRGVDVQRAGIGETLLAPGSTLPFTLVREVARGGAGVVFEARASLVGSLERTIALKLAHQRPEGRSPIVHEARVAVRFRGPGVVPILDLDPVEGWLAMAWASGGSLRARLRRSDVPAPRRWLAPLLEALADVHAAGWVHGDVKPANVLFAGDDQPWLGDFALARRLGDEQTAGSPGYVSPERIGGAPCDPRDDVFGVGCILDEVARAIGADDAALRTLAAKCRAPASSRPTAAGAVLAELRGASRDT